MCNRNSKQMYKLKKKKNSNSPAKYTYFWTVAGKTYAKLSADCHTFFYKFTICSGRATLKTLSLTTVRRYREQNMDLIFGIMLNVMFY